MRTCLLLLSLLFGGMARATNYYFSSSTGDDSRTATQAQNPSTPWKTLSKLNSIFSTLLPGDNIYFMRGDVFYGSIAVGKSGTSSVPITLSAYGSGASPVISGFTAIAGWTNIGSNIWESSVAASTLSTCNIVSIGGTNYAKGRTPDIGYWTIASTNGSTTITDAAHLNAASANWTGAEVVVRELMYQVNRHTITAASGNTITFDAGSIPANWGYFIQNDIKACNLQNEWSYNNSTKKISIFSAGTPVNVKIPTIDEAVNLGSKDYITFDNLNIQGYNTTGINTMSRTGIKIQNCTFSFIGVNAIYAYPNSNNLKVTASTFTDCGSRAIHGGSSSSAVISGNTLLRIGHFAGMGSSGDDSFTGIIANGDNSEVSYNNITNVGYCGIRWDGNSTVIKGNFVNTTNYIKDDGGGIYCYPVQYGNTAHTQSTRTVRDNIVLNSVGAPEGSPYGKQGMGIYMDGQSPNIRVIHNSVSGGVLGIFINGGHDIYCDSNTTYNFTNGYYLLKIGGPVDNETVTNNIFVAAGTGSASCGSGSYPANFQPGTTSMPSSFTASKNIYARPLDQSNGWIFSIMGSNQCRTLAQWQSATGKDAGSVSSPLTTTNASNLRFEYNETGAAKTISLGATYIDMKNVSYPGSITLAPYSSAVLLKTGAASNIAPTANAGSDVTISLPTLVATLSGSGSDPDGTISSYTWTKISGPTGVITSVTSAITTITSLLQGTYLFELKVTDNAGATGRDTVKLTVNPAGNIAPTANAGADQTITLPVSTVNLAGTGTDSDGTIGSYAWTKISGPASGIITAASSSNTTVTSLAAGVYVFQLKITDNRGATATDNVQITVNAATGTNIAPVANAGANVWITLPSNSTNISGTGTDPDGNIAAYSWSKVSGPTSGSISNPSAASTSVTGLVQGVYKWELKVTDNKGSVGRDTVYTIVNPASGTTTKVINVNVYGGTNPYNSSQWNNWSPVVNTASANYTYSDGTPSPVNGKLSASSSIIDNGATFGSTSTACPPPVLRYSSVYNAQRKLTISGLDPAKKYSFTFYASSTVAAQGTSYLIGSVSNDIMTYNNIKSASIVNVVPTAAGLVDIKLLSIYTYNYISGFTITEQNGTVTGKGEEPAIPENPVTISKAPESVMPLTTLAFPNPFTEYVNVQLSGGETGIYQLALFDLSGRAVWKGQVNKNIPVIIERINTVALTAGIYMLQVIDPSQQKKSYKLLKTK